MGTSPHRFSITSGLLLSLCSSACVLQGGCESVPPAQNAPNSAKVDETTPAQGPPKEKAQRIAEKKTAPAPRSPLERAALAIRQVNYTEAAQALDAMRADEKSSPTWHYARALTAFKTGEFTQAIELLHQIEKNAPWLQEEASHLRTQAAEGSGDATLIDAFAGKPHDSLEELDLAESYLHAQEYEKAIKIAEHVLQANKKSKKSSARANLSRAHRVLAEAQEARNAKREALTSWRYLALEAPTSAAAKDAAERYEVLSKSTLSAPERFKRAKAFADDGASKATDLELQKAAKAPGKRPTKAESLAVSGWGLYLARSNYSEAAARLANAARLGHRDKQRLTYYQAKSLARANRDLEAINIYDALGKESGEFAEHALYQAARLRYIDGQFPAAFLAYEAYEKRYGTRARHRREVGYEKTITALAAKEYPKAEESLGQLISKEKSPRKRTRLVQLEGVALLAQGKKKEAEEKFRTVMRSRPLSLAALLAAARLRSMNAAPEPWLPLSQSSVNAQPGVLEALEPELPKGVAALNAYGLDEMAQSLLRRSEASLRERYGKRKGEALCQAYGQLQTAQRRYQIAQWAVSWESIKRPPTPTTRWAWDCLYPRPWLELARKNAEELNVPLDLIYGVMRQESAFRPRVVSPAKAVGLMQIIPPTARRIALELKTEYSPEKMRVPDINLRFGSFYLSRLLKVYQGRKLLAAASYNAGPYAVSRWLESGENLDLDIFIARIPYKETREYAYRVGGNIARYAWLEEDLDALNMDLNIPKGLRANRGLY